MVKKFKPDLEVECGYGMFSEDRYYNPKMTEDKNGAWVKLSTYTDETNRLRAEVERLKQQLRIKNAS